VGGPCCRAARATILAHEAAFAPARRAKPAPDRSGPADVGLHRDLQDVFFNGEAIQLLHQPAAHPAATVSLFRRSDVIVTGGIVDLTSYPVIDARTAFQRPARCSTASSTATVPEDWQDGGTLIVPTAGAWPTNGHRGIVTW
jgi:hypothetical protein